MLSKKIISQASQKVHKSEIDKLAANVCPSPGDCCIRVYSNSGAPTTRLNCGSGALYASADAIVASGWVMTATDPSTNANLIYTSAGCLDETTPSQNLNAASSCGGTNDLCIKKTTAPLTTNIYTYGTGDAYGDQAPELCDCVVTTASGCGTLPETTPIFTSGSISIPLSVEYDYPSYGTVYNGNQPLPFTCSFGAVEITINGNTIVANFLIDSDWTTASFNGPVFYFSQPVTSAQLTNVIGIAGYTNSIFSTNGNQLLVNWQSLPIVSGASIAFQVTTALNSDVLVQKTAIVCGVEVVSDCTSLVSLEECSNYVQLQNGIRNPCVRPPTTNVFTCVSLASTCDANL